MISHLSGTLFEKSTQSIIVQVGGVGYEVFVPLSTFYVLPEKNGPISLHIHTHVREDALVLFGFSTKLEKSLFLMLVSVSGIGPKLSANILSGMGAEELLRAIAAGDAPRLQVIPGIGRKTAERIALELKDRAATFSEDAAMPPSVTSEAGTERAMEDTLSALINLGYSAKMARAAMEKAKIRVKDKTLEGLIKESLKILA
ncbi:MAG: Holliday junction branch migration protein RuvA [Deltaproteobacteria bacterium]|jgi:Holliday junction DNA helicase RuvA|nr:Holliday junction branch migration protein RuvA [Deltaproteobacteria bacterium]